MNLLQKKFPMKVVRPRFLVLPKEFKRFLGLLILFSSAFLFFTQVFIPAVTTQVEARTVSPVPDDFFDEMALRRLEVFAFDELKFGQSDFSGFDEDGAIPKVFYLTVPKLGLNKIAVETNSVDTTPHEMLGHYKGSTLPGRPGNTFVYGHSTLPSHFDINNYKTLFTFLPDLVKGDEIIIDYGDKELKYVVEAKEIVKPEGLDPLKRKNLHYSSISLMTCVPPGTTKNRLVVTAKQVY